MPEAAETGTRRGPGRPSVRETAARDSRALAKQRAAEILDHVGDLDQGTDEFAIDASLIPDGWTYEWKRHTVYGAEDPAYQVHLARMGWQPVPVERHPEMMPGGWKGNVIERKGMILMERPQEITDKVRNIDKKRARDQVRMKEEQLNSAPQGHFSRDEDERTKARVRKSYEPIEIPED